MINKYNQERYRCVQSYRADDRKQRRVGLYGSAGGGIKAQRLNISVFKLLLVLFFQIKQIQIALKAKVHMHKRKGDALKLHGWTT